MSAPRPEEARQAVDLFRAGRDDEVIALARGFTERYPAHPLGWMLCAAALKRQNRHAEALTPAQRAIELMPDRPELHSNLGTSLYRLDRFDEAEAAYRRALALDPAHPDALFNLGRLQTRLSRFAESAATFAALVQARPGDAEAHTERGIALGGLERWVEAERSLRQAITLGDQGDVVHDHLARTLLEQGRPDEAMAVQRAGIALHPGRARLLGNLLFYANHVPGEAGLPPEAADFARAMAPPADAPRVSWSVEPEPTRLRIGLVSGDLKRHPVASFLLGFIPHLAAQGIELHAFATTTEADAVTDRLRPYFAGWHALAGLDTTAAARAVAAQGIHLLFDLAGHTAQHRLDVFALRPAPLQATWLGVPASTALPAIDVVPAAPGCLAPGDEAAFTEQPWPWPEAWFSYTPLEPPPAPSPLPALANGHVTFGSFNSFTKVNDTVIRTWAAVLQAVPGARLLLRCWQLQDAALVQQVRTRFAAQGIDASRLDLEGPIVSLASHLAQYHRVDVALDTFPYVGGTTTAEALFMGVPVVSLRGAGRMLRIGESLLQGAGLGDWVAADEADYVRRATGAAQDLPALAALRTQLRPRLEGTAWLDGRRFAAQFAQAAWSLWRERGAASHALNPRLRGDDG